MASTENRLSAMQKVQGFERSQRFFSELLDSVETLTEIADIHGARTLSDIMFLQSALLSGGFIDYYPGESEVLSIASSLPSGSEWATFIKVEYLLQEHRAEEPQVRCNYSLTLRGFSGHEEPTVLQVLTVGSNHIPSSFQLWLENQALYLPDGKSAVAVCQTLPCNVDTDFVLPADICKLKQRIEVLIGATLSPAKDLSGIRLKDIDGKPVEDEYLKTLFPLVSAAADALDRFSEAELENYADAQRHNK